MNGWHSLVAALSLLIAGPASAHRLDEYLQATTLAIDKAHIQAEMRFSPGVAVFPIVFSDIDRDGDGIASEAEQRRYAERVLRDVSLSVDGVPLAPRLVSASFAPRTLLEDGRGEIHLKLEFDVAATAARRRLTFENRHQRGIGVYLVNALVPVDPAVQLGTQSRSEDQSSYAIDYIAAPPTANAFSLTALAAHWTWLDGALLALIGAVAATGPRMRGTRRKSRKDESCAS